MAMPAPKKRVPLGQPLQLTDQQIDDLAKITPGDIAKAQVFWRSTAPAEFKTLLDAQLIENDDAKDEQ